MDKVVLGEVILRVRRSSSVRSVSFQKFSSSFIRLSANTMYQPTASFSDTFKILETCIRNVPCSSMDQGTNCPVRGRRAFRRVRKIAKSDYELRFVCPPVLYSECPLFEYGPGHKNCEKRL